jgi:hypothetical protein
MLIKIGGWQGKKNYPPPASIQWINWISNWPGSEPEGGLDEGTEVVEHTSR